MTSKRTEKARTTSAGMQLSLESRAPSSDDHELEYPISSIVFYPIHPELNLSRFYARAAAEFKGEEPSFPLSRSSASSLPVTWQKHRREREKKFLQAAQTELDKHVGVPFLSKDNLLSIC